MAATSTQRRYAIEYEPRDQYLCARVSGPSDSVEISLAYWSEIAAECRRLGYSKLLVCESLGKPGPALEYYLVGCALPKVLDGLRVAFVDTSADEIQPNRLGETVAFNRGAEARMFLDEATAITWLTSGR